MGARVGRREPELATSLLSPDRNFAMPRPRTVEERICSSCLFPFELLARCKSWCVTSPLATTSKIYQALLLSSALLMTFFVMNFFILFCLLSASLCFLRSFSWKSLLLSGLTWPTILGDTARRWCSTLPCASRLWSLAWPFKP